MTSANFIMKRPNVDYGEWHEHYILPWGDCHPDYTAIPVGKPMGVKVCKRRESRIAETPKGNQMAYWGQENLYEPGKPETRNFNNLSRDQRKIPEEVKFYVREKKVDRFQGVGIL